MQTSVTAALAQLEGLAGSAYGDTLARLRDRPAAARLRVLVVGEAKRGKSTLVNALLGWEVLPTGVTPLTVVPASVKRAPPEHEDIEVTFAVSGTERFPLSEVQVFGTERGKPGNCRYVAALTVGVASVLARGVEIVEPLGTASLCALTTAAAEAALPSMDAAIFVLTADPPMSASERELLRRVARLSVKLFVVLNKADYLSAASLAAAEEFTGGVVAEATGRPQRIYPLSAIAALGPGGDPGFTVFSDDFSEFLDIGRVAGLELSVTRHARRVAEQLMDEVALAQRAAQLPGENAGAQLAAFATQLSAVASRGQDAQDRATAQSGRLLDALNDAAEQARPRR